MSHIRCSYFDSIRTVGGKLVRAVYATWDSKRHGHGSFEVYRIDTDRKERVRNMDYNFYSNYMFRDPKDGIEKWGEPVFELTAFKEGWSHPITENEIGMMKSVYPDFKWTLDKAIKRFNVVTLAFAFRLLIEWKTNSKVEYLVNDGLVYLIFNDTFKKMSSKKQVETVRFIKEKLDGRDTPLSKVAMMMKLGISEKEYDTWKEYRPFGTLVPYTAYKYMTANSLKVNTWKKRAEWEKKMQLYLDYYGMAKKAGHDMYDKYWWNPKDLRKMHDKVMKECALIEEAKKIREQQKLAEKTQKKKDDFEKLMKKWAGKTFKKGCIEIFVPQTYDEVDEHAKKLNQCLIYSDYVQKVVDKKILLVFVKMKGKPNATAEIKRDGTIGQFYADEHAKNIHPSETVKQMMNEWIEMYKPNLKRSEARSGIRATADLDWENPMILKVKEL